MNGAFDEEKPEGKGVYDLKVECGVRKEQENLNIDDPVVEEDLNDRAKDRDELMGDLNSPVNANTMIMNQSEMENNGAVVMDADRKAQLESMKKQRPSTTHILSTMFPCFNRCIKKNS